MEEATFCTMLVLNVGPYRKPLRFREVPTRANRDLTYVPRNRDVRVQCASPRMHL
jgi:hypothetical protein